MKKNILEVCNLQKSFKQNFWWKIHVLRWLNLEVKKWEVYGFLWPNGAGKTTSLKCILGFLSADDWEKKVFWENIEKNKDLYKNIWYAPEHTYFYDHLNWIEFLIFMWQLCGMTKQESELNGLNLLEKLGLTYAKDKYVKDYSKGMKQRLWLAASLINDPDFILWDEPMSGLDPLGRVVVKDLMKELKENWKTIFFNTHILSDVEEVADRFGIVYDGRIIYKDKLSNLEKSLEELFKNVIEEESEKIEIS